VDISLRDYAIKEKRDYFWLLGRSDEVLKVSGYRIVSWNSLLFIIEIFIRYFMKCEATYCINIIKIKLQYSGNL